MLPVRVAGHALHPLLVITPLGLLLTSCAWDAVYLGGGEALWARIAFYAAVTGVAGALAAAVPGFVDRRAVAPDAAARRALRAHAVYGLAGVAAIGLSLALRGAASVPRAVHMMWSWLGTAAVLRGAWLGSRVAERLADPTPRPDTDGVPSGTPSPGT